MMIGHFLEQVYEKLEGPQDLAFLERVYDQREGNKERQTVKKEGSLDLTILNDRKEGKKEQPDRKADMKLDQRDRKEEVKLDQNVVQKDMLVQEKDLVDDQNVGRNVESSVKQDVAVVQVLVVV